MKGSVDLVIKCIMKILFHEKSKWIFKKGVKFMKSRPFLCFVVILFTIFGLKLMGCSSVNEAFLSVVEEHSKTLSSKYTELVKEKDNPEFVVYDKIDKIYRKIVVEEQDPQDPSKKVKKNKFRSIKEDEIFYYKVRDKGDPKKFKFRKLKYYKRIELFTPKEKKRHIKTRLRTVSELNRVIQENKEDYDGSKDKD